MRLYEEKGYVYVIHSTILVHMKHKKTRKMYLLHQLRPTNQLSGQKVFIIKFKKTSTVPFSLILSKCYPK